MAERDREHRPSYLSKSIPFVPQLGADAEGLQARLEDPVNGLGPRDSFYFLLHEDRRKRESRRQEGS